MKSVRVNLLCWGIVLTVIILLTVPVLIQDGMFMDAVQYSAVAHNLSQGIGSFWALQFDVHNIHELPAFSEQPPLAFGIQSLFYKLFGDSIYVERFYTFLCLSVHVLLIIQLWSAAFKNNEEYKQFAWLPLLFWITIPIVFWSFRNNMLENTMGIFILLSAIFIYKSLLTGSYLHLIFGGICIFLASFTKGIPGLFSLTMPILFSFVCEKAGYKKAVMQTGILVLILMVFYLLLLTMPSGREFYERYFINRTLQRINSDPTTSSRLFILQAFFVQILAPLSTAVFLILLNKFKPAEKRSSKLVRTGIFFLAVGLCGVLPLTITKIQKPFYLTPAFPFIALGLAILCMPVCKYYFNILKDRVKFQRGFLSITLIFIIVTIIITSMSFGDVSRNEMLLNDVNKLGQTVPEYAIISSSTNVYYNWILHSYMIRYYTIRFDYAEKYEYLLLDNQYDTEPDSSYKKVDIGLEGFRLYKTL